MTIVINEPRKREPTTTNKRRIPERRDFEMIRVKDFVLIGQYGGQKWIIGDYETEREALDVMSSRIKQNEEKRKSLKGRAKGPILRITVLKFYSVYEADS